MFIAITCYTGRDNDIHEHHFLQFELLKMKNSNKAVSYINSFK